MHILLFEDHLTAENRPITLPRPAFAVSVAATRLYDVARHFASGVSAIVRPYLKEVADDGFEFTEISGDVLALNASLAPSYDILAGLVSEASSGELVIEKEGRALAAYFLSTPVGIVKQSHETICRFILEQELRRVETDLQVISAPHELIRAHQKFFNDNILHLTAGHTETSKGVFCGKNVKIHPTAVIESVRGPIILEENVSVGPFALLIGPIIVGRATRIIERATIKEQVQIGHNCKIGGEIECSSIESFTNKQAPRISRTQLRRELGQHGRGNLKL